MVCIYAIKNTENGKIYIGSTNNMTKRFKKHKSELRGNKHYNEYLQRAFNKYGENSLDFIILTTCGEHQLVKKEIEYIQKYHALDSNYGYNLILPREASTRNISEEYRKKISDSKKGVTPANFEEMRRKKWRSVNFYERKVFKDNFPSVKNLAEFLGIHPQNIHNYLKGKIGYLRYHPTWHFEYKQEEL